MIEWLDCYGTVSQDRIEHIEKTIGRKLPDAYLSCVKECDGGNPIKMCFQYFDQSLNEEVGSGIACFLRLNDSEFSNFLEYYLDPPEFFPENLIAFGDSGCGDLICFDYRNELNNSTPPIVLWNHGAEVGLDVSFVAKNFEEFLSILKKPAD